MDKARQAHFSAEILDGRFRANVNGTEDDLALCIQQGLTGIIRKHPYMRRKFRKAVRVAMYKTAPDWVHRAIADLPWSIFGAAVIYGALRGVGVLLHWIGVC